MKEPSYIFIHHTAVSWKKNPDQWKATNAYHKKKWNMKSSLGYYGGYNYEVAADGSVKQFRQDGEVTVAQYQQHMNDGRAISICMDGNFDQENPTNAQKKAVEGLLKEKMNKFDIPELNVHGHRYVAPKTCPGKNVTDPVYDYFVTSTPMEKIPIQVWAEEAFEWLWDNNYARKSEAETEDFQRQVVIMYRIHN